ncbi:MAG: putative cytochrome c with heme-binding site [Pseudobdellovibrio sp.]|nr:putative cytochrome c with heme-binding site [Pseudobdellovibrio sp.]
MKILKRILIGLVAVIALVVVIVKVSFNSKLNQTFAKPELQIHEDVIKADVELGKRLYSVRSGCIDCHGADLSGALIMEDPAMGNIHGANIAPYKLKDWSDEDIARAIRYGVHKDGRSLRFMPSFDFEGLSKGDLAAMIAYLRSVPAVEKESHQNTFGPIAHVLSVTGQMPIMFPAAVIDQSKGFVEKPAEGPTFEFGKYLASSCVGCHRHDYTGGKIQGGDPAWPPAADIRLGNFAAYNQESFKQMVMTGKSPVTGNMLRPPMPVHLLKQLNETETQALWAFLSTLK